MSYHIMVDCNIRGSQCGRVSDDVIIDSGASACIVNIYYLNSILEFESMTGDLTCAGRISLDAITGRGRMKVLTASICPDQCSPSPF